MEWVALVKLNLPRSLTDDVHGGASHSWWNATRFVLSAMQVMYYQCHGTGVDEQEWAVMMQRGLLGVEEVCKGACALTLHARTHTTRTRAHARLSRFAVSRGSVRPARVRVRRCAGACPQVVPWQQAVALTHVGAE